MVEQDVEYVVEEVANLRGAAQEMQEIIDTVNGMEEVRSTYTLDLNFDYFCGSKSPLSRPQSSHSDASSRDPKRRHGGSTW